MAAIDDTVDRLDWTAIAAQLDSEGHALLPGWLGAGAARELARQLATSATVHVPLAAWRAAFYRRLVGIANRWNATLGADGRYPAALDDFLRNNRQAGQTREQSHLNRLGVGDQVLLHQRKEGEQVFPLQVVALLSEPGLDFEGGDFVMTEQRPRLQSRPMVLPLRLGDAAIIATAERPFQGSRGAYRVQMRHAIGRVRRGERVGLELTFHHAPDADAGAGSDPPQRGATRALSGGLW